VEKALKAAIASQDLEFPFTHDLGLLMQLCEDAGFELPGDLAEADRLTPYAAALRYGLGNPEAVAAGSALRWAALAVAWADAEIHPAEDESTTDQDV
jgi:HEPN domain-containing protein